jgi:hypothetical protein
MIFGTRQRFERGHVVVGRRRVTINLGNTHASVRRADSGVHASSRDDSSRKFPTRLRKNSQELGGFGLKSALDGDVYHAEFTFARAQAKNATTGIETDAPG